MNLITWPIRNPIPVILIFLLLTFAGIVGFRALHTQDFPDLDLPTVSVTLIQPGAAPSQLETEVARKAEDAMATLQGLRHMTTTITDGTVSIAVEFQLERELTDALADVKDAIDRIRSDLPRDVEEPQVTKITVGPGGPILTYAISSSRFNEEALSWFTDDVVARAVLAVPGVGRFSRVGGVQREVQVLVDPVKLNALGVTAASVSSALRSVQQDASGGRGQLGGQEQGVRTIATVKTAQDLAALPIALSAGRYIRLDQVATVSDTIAERSQAALLNGTPSVGFQVSRSKGYDEGRIAEGVERALATLVKQTPGLQVELIKSTVTQTQEQYQGSMEMLFEGALLSILVVWLFLRDWRETVLGAVALPLSILPTFAVMYYFDYSLNTITLLALAVVVGILVDDAIVEVENIARHARMGKTVLQATEEAVNEIALAVTATTATLIVVFLPTAFMSGIPGMVFKQFGWTVAAAVFASFLVARLVTPLMAVWLLKPKKQVEKDGRLMSWYMGLARWCLKHPLVSVVAGIGFFVFSLALVPLLPTGFIPASDSGDLTISVELPPGSNIDSTLEAAEDVRRVVKDIPGVKSVFTTIGEAQESGHSFGAAPGEVRKAAISLVLTERGTRPKQQVIEKEIRERLKQVPGARFSLSGGGPGEKLQIVLSSRDGAVLKSTAQAIEADLRKLPYLSNINSTASLERPEITIRPNAARAAERGVTTQSIGDTIRIATSGDFDAALAKLNLDDRQLDIRVRIPDAMRTDLNTIAALRVPGAAGLVTLDSVAHLGIESGPSQIDRYDRVRNVVVSADLGGYSLGNALAEAKELPTLKALPPGVQTAGSGDAEFMAELFGGFGLAMMTGILCMYCVLVLLFKDWFQPITILAAIPLSFGGAFVAMMLAGAELSLPTLIGLVMLLGIVTKNSILLVEYAIMGERDLKMTQIEALLDACHKRARPIVMTTVAMVGGMTPLALGYGGDASFRQPMAIAVIGGLITSTALSLLMVPVVFTYVAALERRVTSLFRGTRKAAAVAPQGD